jgi:negative regulator of genetic competence, sporulation and motility
MELILINKNKLKIMLDESDMKKYHIGSESDCAEGSTRKAIRNLLESAKDRIGFDTDGKEIFVQLYASKKGGCELFVTKCQAQGNDGEEFESNQRKQDDLCALPIKKQAALPVAKEKRGSRLAFSFVSLNDLIKVCKILTSKGNFHESRAYSASAGIFYLLLYDVGSSAYSRLDSLTFITEYGTRERDDRLLSYISEHGKLICDGNAVSKLSEF